MNGPTQGANYQNSSPEIKPKAGIKHIFYSSKASTSHCSYQKSISTGETPNQRQRCQGLGKFLRYGGDYGHLNKHINKTRPGDSRRNIFASQRFEQIPGIFCDYFGQIKYQG